MTVHDVLGALLHAPIWVVVLILCSPLVFRALMLVGGWCLGVIGLLCEKVYHAGKGAAR